MVIKTNKGYLFFEVSSAFQKSIRRGEEEQALYWGIELYMSNFDEYAWKRMQIIVSEDIGLAVPFLPATIKALYDMYQYQLKKGGDHREERLFFIHAILLLVRSKKSRLVDYTLITYFRNHAVKDFPIPDYAFDMHNYKGKQMGRGVDHFFKDGAHLENYADVSGEKEMKIRARKAWDLPKVIFKPREKKKKEDDGLFAGQSQDQE